jgi:hypothetical protein
MGTCHLPDGLDDDLVNIAHWDDVASRGPAPERGLRHAENDHAATAVRHGRDVFRKFRLLGHPLALLALAGGEGKVALPIQVVALRDLFFACSFDESERQAFPTSPRAAWSGVEGITRR